MAVTKESSLEMTKGGGDSGSHPTGQPAVAGYGSKRDYGKSGQKQDRPSMTPDFNPMKHMPRAITGVGGSKN